MVRILSGLSALFALAASAIAFIVASDGSAERIMATVRAHGGMDLFGSDFDALVNSLIHDGRYNAIAAALAALSALLQAAAFITDQKKRHGAASTRLDAPR